ncbi:MAG: DUF4175 family protein [Gemmatimonadales bacterium]
MSGTDLDLLHAIRRVRRKWRTRVLLEGVAKVALAALLALLAGALLSGLLGPGSQTVIVMRVMGYLLIAAALVRFVIAPAFRQPDNQRLALYVEERAPDLRQALISAVHHLETTAEPSSRPAVQPSDPAAEPPSAESRTLGAVIVEHALSELRNLEQGPGLERSRVQRSAAVLGGVLGAAAVLLLVGPIVIRDAARVLFVPWSEAEAAPVLGISVSPGNAAIPRGGAVQVRAALRGFEAEGAELVIRADTATDWVRIPMQRDSAAAEFTARLFDLVSATEYFVEAEGVKSPAFRLTVTDLPAVQRLALELRFPAYTGLPAERIDPGGDVAAVTGTTVIVRATLTRPARAGAIRLDDRTTIPLRADSAGRWSGSFRVTQDGFYRIDLTAPDGTAVPGSVQYVIEALDDAAPTVAIEQPGRDTRVSSVEEVTIAVRASDDYGVTRLGLVYSVNGGPEQRVMLTDSTGRASPEARAAHTLFLEELGLKAGDLISYHAIAQDGAGGTGSSDIYFLEVRPYGRDYRQAEAGGGGGGGGGNSPEGLSARQRDIIAGTFNWLRDSARTVERQRREDLTTLAIAQGRIKQDVSELVRRLAERGIAESDTNFAKIKEELEAAGREMQTAEETLGRGLGRDALPPEQRALQHVQRAEAVYREVQVQLGGGGGGGGGAAQSRAEDLADLFELENDKLRNQYESVQRDRSQAADQQLDEIAERLRQLAARQQQENERMQRAAEAMRDRTAQQGGGGGGGGGSGQRELARQADEEARRLERLAREQNRQELAEVARQLRQAADQMRRAAGESPNAASQGSSALDRLRNATRNLENSRSSALSERIRELGQRGQQLAEQQRDIAGSVNALPQAGAERSERVRRLDERKAELAEQVDRLQSDAERVAREGRREQPGAATRVGQAAEAIQQARIRDRILYSRDVMRGNVPEYARQFEQVITDNLNDVANRLREAAGALSESGGGRQERALERARELVRGLESLRERTGAAQGERGAPGERGAQGEQGAQGARGEPGERGAPGGQGQQGGQPGQQGGLGARGQEDPGGLGAPSPLGGGGGRAPASRMGGEDIRQFTREFRLRREAAENLRRELAREGGVELGELDRAIRGLRQLETGQPFRDPSEMEQLQAAIIEGLKTWEFRLWRAFAQGGDKGPAVGTPSQAPPEYRALVEEYYRSLARERKP